MRFWYFLIATIVLVLDQGSKGIVTGLLSGGRILPVLPGVFQLVFVENRGLAFGLFADSSSGLAFGLTVLVSVLALGLVSFLLWKEAFSSRWAGAGLACILGGALGNLADRLLRGAVVDFLDFSLGSYHWPAFNVADTAIVVGAGLLLLDLARTRTPNPSRDREGAVKKAV